MLLKVTILCAGVLIAGIYILIISYREDHPKKAKDN